MMHRLKVRAQYGTGDFLNLQKRNCPIKLELTPYGCDDLFVTWEIAGHVHSFQPESIISGGFTEFMHAVYNLYHEKNDQHKFPRYREKRMQMSGERQDLRDGEMQITTRVWWDQHEYSNISFSRKDDWDVDGFYAATPDPIQIEILRCRESQAISYTVDGKDLAYAIGKAATDAIKRYGFYGYFFSSGSNDECGDYYRIHELLFFKAYALDAMEVRKLRTVWRGNDYHHAEGTDFKKELELLLFDM